MTLLTRGEGRTSTRTTIVHKHNAHRSSDSGVTCADWPANPARATAHSSLHHQSLQTGVRQAQRKQQQDDFEQQRKLLAGQLVHQQASAQGAQGHGQQ